jgi:tetratricopeptide (TPR) repeat protein
MSRISRPILFVLLLGSCATQAGRNGLRSSSAAEQASTEAAYALGIGDYERALVIADAGLASDSQDPWLLYNRGSALAGLGRFDEALEALLRAEGRFATEHERSLPVYRRALVLESRGRCAEASTELSRYAALVRDDAPDLARDALTHLQYCFPPTAAQAAEREESARLAIQTKDEQRKRAQAASTAAVRALIAGDYKSALVEAEAGLAFAPSDAWLAYNRGTALAGLEHTDEAIEALRVAEHLFAPEDSHGQSLAAYRRIVALDDAGRCQEIAQELRHYADVAGSAEAEHAATHARFCRVASTKHHPPS